MGWLQTMIYDYLRAALLVACLVSVPPTVRAAIVFQGAENMFEMNEQTFNQWLYSSSQGRFAPEAELTMTVDAVDRACQLTDEQKKKLRLAGRGDFARFARRVEELRAKYVGKQFPQDEIGEVHQQIQPLAQVYQAGILGDSSLFSKVLSRTLSAEQRESHGRVEAERRQARYAAKVQLFVAMCERSCPLTDDQRTKLIELLTTETRPPKLFGQYDWYVVMYQASQIPDEKFSAFLDEAQMRAFKRSLQQGVGFGHFLKQQGILEAD